MLKNKWFMGILALGLIATVVYNLSYFASRGRPPAPSAEALAIGPPAQPQVATNSIGGNRPPENGVSEALARPPLSLEEITQQAQNPVSIALKREPSPKKTYPERDPFQGVAALRLQVLELEPKAMAATSSDEMDTSPLEPTLRVTAILVQGERRFAVINGYAKRVGASVGPWQIAAIEPGYVMVRTPDGDRKIEIEKQIGDAKPEPKQ
jgi:hypothetical protein